MSFSLIQYFFLQPLELVCSVRALLAEFIHFFQQSRYSDGVSIVNYVLNKMTVNQVFKLCSYFE